MTTILLGFVLSFLGIFFGGNKRLAIRKYIYMLINNGLAIRKYIYMLIMRQLLVSNGQSFYTTPKNKTRTCSAKTKSIV